VNIPDAYSDHRFNSSFDSQTGFRTKQVMCCPVFDPSDGSVLGVLQLMNCKDQATSFNDADVRLCEKLNAQVGAAISRCLRLKEEQERVQQQREEDMRSINILKSEVGDEAESILALKKELEALNKEKESVVTVLESERNQRAKVESDLSQTQQIVKETTKLTETKQQKWAEEMRNFELQLKKAETEKTEIKQDLTSVKKIIAKNEELDEVWNSAEDEMTEMKKMFQVVCVNAVNFMNADRATLFIVDRENNTLYSLVAQGRDEIRVGLSEGIVGHAACTGETVMIEDAYKDPRFNKRVDLESGYVTKSIIASPVFCGSGLIVGVMQVINKRNAPGSTSVFNPEDRKWLQMFNKRVGTVVDKCKKISELEKKNELELQKEKKITEKFSEDLTAARKKEKEVRGELEKKEKELSIEVQKEMELKDDLAKAREFERVTNDLADDTEMRDMFDHVCEAACRLLDADRATLFLVDLKEGQLYSQIHHGSNEIRIGLRQGVAGQCYSAGQLLNITDAYNDSRFNPEVDKKSGYRTRTILCLPIREKNGEVVAILQVINKNGHDEARDSFSVFSKKDENVISALGKTAATSIHRCQEFGGMQTMLEDEKSKERILSDQLKREKVLVKVTKMIDDDLELQNLFDKACDAALEFMDADRASLFLVDRETQELWSKIAHGHDGQEIRIPLGVGIAGTVGVEGSIINIEDAYKDRRFNPDVDRRSGYHTKTILAGAIREKTSGQVVGVLQLINKGSEGVFNEDDEDCMTQLCSTLASAIYRCQEYSGIQKMLSDEQQKELELTEELERERLLIKLGSAIANDLQMQTLFTEVCESACTLMKADRASLFLVDRKSSELSTQFAKGHDWQEIRVPLGVGVAGNVAMTGEVANIKDAYQDSRFNPEVDKKSGYRTKTILCGAVRESTTGEIVGVLQIINKENNGFFTPIDERTMIGLSSTVAGGIMRCSEFNELKREMEAQIEVQRMALEQQIETEESDWKKKEMEYMEKLKTEEQQLEAEKEKGRSLESRLKEEMTKETQLELKGAKLEKLLQAKDEEAEGEMMEGLKELADLGERFDQMAKKNKKGELDDLMEQVCTHACSFMKADRASIFFYDKAKNMLWSKVALGTESTEIR
jgi:GAF domain-containing protein